MEFVYIIIGAIFVNNIVLSKFLGVCPFIGVSKKVDTAVGMTGAVTFVMVIATIVTYLIQKFVLEKYGIQYMQTMATKPPAKSRVGATITAAIICAMTPQTTASKPVTAIPAAARPAMKPWCRLMGRPI